MKKVKIKEIVGQKENMDLLQYAVEKNKAALLVGDTGTGKTSAIRALAKAHGKAFHRINLNGQSGTDEIVGKLVFKDGKTQWIDGLLVTAMKRGEWILFDEINAASPEVLFALHSLLDDDRMIVLAENENEVIRPHENFRFFASCNPPDTQYSGTRELNAAFVSRFPVVTLWEYPSQSAEAEILQSRTGIDTDTTAMLLEVAKTLRKYRKEEKIIFPCSTRDLLECAEAMQGGIKEAAAIEMTLVNKALDATERQVISKTWRDLSKSKQDLKGIEMTVAEIIKEWKNGKENITLLQQELSNKTEIVDTTIAKLNSLLNPVTHANNK